MHYQTAHAKAELCWLKKSYILNISYFCCIRLSAGMQFAICNAASIIFLGFDFVNLKKLKTLRIPFSCRAKWKYKRIYCGSFACCILLMMHSLPKWPLCQIHAMMNLKIVLPLFWKGGYSKEKGNTFFPFRVDSFSEGNQTGSHKISSTGGRNIPSHIKYIIRLTNVLNLIVICDYAILSFCFCF